MLNPSMLGGTVVLFSSNEDGNEPVTTPAADRPAEAREAESPVTTTNPVKSEQRMLAGLATLMSNEVGHEPMDRSERRCADRSRYYHLLRVMMTYCFFCLVSDSCH